MRGRDSFNPVPRPKQDSAYEGVPDKSLTLEQIEGLDGDDCLDLIEERHGLLAETLFSNSTVPAPTTETGKWDRENLPKVALMRLEGFSSKVIADFFSREFSLLHRKELFVSAGNVALITSNYFSPKLKQKIREYGNERALGGVLLSENRALITRIEKKTGLRVGDLFSGKRTLNVKSTSWGVFKPIDVLRAFAMRLENNSYEDILASFGKTYSRQLHSLLSTRITETFSEEARRFLPNNRSRYERTGGNLE